LTIERQAATLTATPTVGSLPKPSLHENQGGSVLIGAALDQGPLEGNQYAVDPSLVGRRVELRYGPEDLTRIDIFYEGRSAGVATPFVIGRHTHRAVPQAARPAPAPTGVDYLGLVAAAHEEAASTGTKVDFTQLAIFELGDEEQAQ